MRRIKTLPHNTGEACVRLLVVALAAGGAAQAWAAAMPAGSRAWMVFTGNACGTHDQALCTTSDAFGPNPPNGIPSSTFTEGSRQPFQTGLAEILPDRMRSFNSGYGGSHMYASMLDTYTVHGVVGGSFEITVHLAADGVARAIPVTDAGNQIIYGLISNATIVEIGGWDPTTNNIDERSRVTQFSDSTQAMVVVPDSTGLAPFEYTVAVETSYARAVSVGDVFDIGYNLSTDMAWGELDLLHTALISFDLPAGVWLTSQNGAVFGSREPVPVPEPATPMLLIAGLGAVFLKRRSMTRPC